MKPKFYLFIIDSNTGEEEIFPIENNVLNFTIQVKRWAHQKGLELDGFHAKLGHFFARIMSDGQDPGIPLCLDAGAFSIKNIQK